LSLRSAAGSPPELGPRVPLGSPITIGTVAPPRGGGKSAAAVEHTHGHSQDRASHCRVVLFRGPRSPDQEPQPPDPSIWPPVSWTVVLGPSGVGPSPAARAPDEDSPSSGHSLRAGSMTEVRTFRTDALAAWSVVQILPGSHLNAAVQLNFPEAVVRARLD